MGVYRKSIRPFLSKARHRIPTRTDLTYWKLYRLRNREFGKTRTAKILNYRIQYLDPMTFFYEFGDIFRHRIYHFESQKRDPLIIDAGSYIGLSILYFKHIYPEARIISFEPDPNIQKILKGNMATNRLTNIDFVNAALSSREGEETFYIHGDDGGSLVFKDDREPVKMKTQVLSKYLNEPVDFLKLNIEGSELDVLKEAESKLALIREIVIEYHMFDTGHQNLHEILDLLSKNGFMYMINDFDSLTNPMTKTPFKMKKDTKYFLLVYAKNMKIA
jgi:FkbM family methyltransferase